MLILEGTVWYRGARRRATYVLHPEKHHNGESADSQKTMAVVIAAGALCVGRGGRKICPGLGGMGGFSLLLTDPSSSSSVTLTVTVIVLVMAFV